MQMFRDVGDVLAALGGLTAAIVSAYMFYSERFVFRRARILQRIENESSGRDPTLAKALTATIDDELRRLALGFAGNRALQERVLNEIAAGSMALEDVRRSWRFLTIRRERLAVREPVFRPVAAFVLTVYFALLTVYLPLRTLEILSKHDGQFAIATLLLVYSAYAGSLFVFVTFMRSLSAARRIEVVTLRADVGRFMQRWRFISMQYSVRSVKEGRQSMSLPARNPSFCARR